MREGRGKGGGSIHQLQRLGGVFHEKNPKFTMGENERLTQGVLKRRRGKEKINSCRLKLKKGFYKMGEYHPKSLEGFWKRGKNGTYRKEGKGLEGVLRN